MNREIKFRAWDKELNKFCNYEYAITLDTDGVIYRNNGEQEAPEVIIMQYTGLKDKNGKEIYEGDVVRFITEFTPRIGTVEWDDEYSRFAVAYKTAWIDFEGINKGEKGIEVIGNIHENPELLDNKQDK